MNDIVNSYLRRVYPRQRVCRTKTPGPGCFLQSPRVQPPPQTELRLPGGHLARRPGGPDGYHKQRRCRRAGVTVTGDGGVALPPPPPPSAAGCRLCGLPVHHGVVPPCPVGF